MCATIPEDGDDGNLLVGFRCSSLQQRPGWPVDETECFGDKGFVVLRRRTIEWMQVNVSLKLKKYRQIK
jgi:hypothetical protein